MKKLFSLALAAALALSLVSCGRSQPATLFEIDQTCPAQLTATQESFTFTLDLDDPKALVDSTLYQGPNGKITLYSVKNVDSSGADLTFLCQGVLEEGRAALLSAAMPDPAAELVTMRKAPVSAAPAELFALDYDAITPEFGKKGNSFRLRLSILDPRAAEQPGNHRCTITVSNLLLTTWEEPTEPELP